MTQEVIQVEGLSKRYRLGRRHDGGELREWLGQGAAALWPFKKMGREVKEGVSTTGRVGEFWALRDVDFTIGAGEVVGIVGRNGAGKSTLLKILSRITAPTRGQVVIDGRVGSLLEVGTGFHPELSGRENIYLNGAILGMTRQEVRAKFDQIVAFAGVEEFLDTPVKRYSSGMYVRLAFAVAAHLEPEVLIVDEVLAVGDMAFQQRCLGRMREVAGQGRTVLFVSHNMAAVQSLCQRAILLDAGRVVQTGEPQPIIHEYLRGVRETAEQPLAERQQRQGNGALRFTAIEVQSGMQTMPASGQDLCLKIHYQSLRGRLGRAIVTVSVYSAWGQCLMVLNNEMTGCAFPRLAEEGVVQCRVPRLPLAPGTYLLNLQAQVDGVVADWVQQAAVLEVAGGDYYGTGKAPPKGHGVLLAQHEWSLAA